MKLISPLRPGLLEPAERGGLQLPRDADPAERLGAPAWCGSPRSSPSASATSPTPSVELGPGIVVLHGPNGAGKTNLLEAVYFGLTNRSFRTGNDRDLIALRRAARRGSSWSSTAAPTARCSLSALERGGERRHRIDGRMLGAATAAAARQRLPSRPPRSWSRARPPTAAPTSTASSARCGRRAPTLRARFGRTLAQRNALVSPHQAPGTPAGSLRAWDAAARGRGGAADRVAGRGGRGARAARSPSWRRGSASRPPEVSYRPRDPGPARSSPPSSRARRAVDLGRAYTSYGPQLDEVEMRLGGKALRRFGSQGQQRAGAPRAALRRAQRPDRGRPPRSAHAARRRDERARSRAPASCWWDRPGRRGPGAADRDRERARPRGRRRRLRRDRGQRGGALRRLGPAADGRRPGPRPPDGTARDAEAGLGGDPRRGRADRAGHPPGRGAVGLARRGRREDRRQTRPPSPSARA